jgi:hypothetical protein
MLPKTQGGNRPISSAIIGIGRDFHQELRTAPEGLPQRRYSRTFAAARGMLWAYG